jgi:hypothetical protein
MAKKKSKRKTRPDFSQIAFQAVQQATGIGGVKPKKTA